LKHLLLELIQIQLNYALSIYLFIGTREATKSFIKKNKNKAEAIAVNNKKKNFESMRNL